MRKVFLVSLMLAVFGFTAAHAQSNLAAPIPEDAKSLAKSEGEYKSAKTAYHHHASPKAKQALVAATDRYAMTSMMGTALSTKARYRQALRLYREALKLDPKNHEAKSNSDLIISIYRSMHRPVPTDG
jgi:tetratricopeptide (TPR) repeat protein